MVQVVSWGLIKSLTSLCWLEAGDRFIYELHLRQPGFTDSAWGPLTKHHENIPKFKENYLKYIYKNELGNVCFAYDSAYSYSKDLDKRTISDKM